MAPLQDLPFFCAPHRRICALQGRTAGHPQAIIERLANSGASPCSFLTFSRRCRLTSGTVRPRVSCETARELSLLSDRELTDLGIARFQIDSVARQSAAA